MIAKISPEANLIVERKGELAARSSKMWHYGMSTEKPYIEINLAKELGSSQGERRHHRGRKSTPKWHKCEGMKGRSRHQVAMLTS